MTTEAILRAALELLEKRASRFTTGALARNPAGKKIAPNSDRAICWDAMGAVLKVARLPRIPSEGPAADAIDLLDRAAVEAGYIGSARRGDAEGITGALQTFRRALVLLDIEGPPTRAEITEGSTT